MNEYNDKEVIKSVVDKIQYLLMVGIDIVGVLKYVCEVMFYKKYGGWELVLKIIIFIMDGMFYDLNVIVK